VLPPIVVDLGPNVAPAEVQYVLDACNEVVAEGECVAEGAQGLIEAPRALAIARNTDRRGRAVRIEVRLTDAEQRPLVRTLRFTPEDPARERWRSVGLAIATLVGEGQRAEDAEQAARAAGEPEPPAAPEPATAEPPAAEPPAERSAEPAPARPPPAATSEPRAARVVVDDEREPVVPLDGIYLGLGVFGGPALDDGSARVGVSLRGGWASPAGFSLLGSASYSVRAASGDAFSVSWLSFSAGVGYRLWLTDSFTAAVNAQAGVQQLRFEATDGGSISDASVVNPLVSLGVDGWWLPWEHFGFWLALEGHTIFRKSELFVGDTRSATTQPVDFTGLLGVGWRIR
jgi:hypothetical protein